MPGVSAAWARRMSPSGFALEGEPWACEWSRTAQRCKPPAKGGDEEVCKCNAECLHGMGLFGSKIAARPSVRKRHGAITAERAESAPQSMCSNFRGLQLQRRRRCSSLPLSSESQARAHEGEFRERRNARYLRSSSSSSAVRSSIAKAANLLRRPLAQPAGGNKYPAFSIKVS